MRSPNKLERVVDTALVAVHTQAARTVVVMKQHQNDQIDNWYHRVRSFSRRAGFALDLAECVFVTIAASLTAAVAGALMAAKLTALWHGAMWLGLIAGALAGGIGGGGLARRVYFGKTTGREKLPSKPEILHAPHRSLGVPEQFMRARRREAGLSLLLIPVLLSLFYMVEADERGWPIPGSLSQIQGMGYLVGLAALIVLLIFRNARCPDCNHRLTGMVSLRQCPFCGVVLRD
jgi:hypothetical protein